MADLYDPAVLPSVAICIPTRNQADFLPLAVASAASQDYAGPTEIWIGDDASTDHTAAVLTRLSAELPELKTLSQSTNIGIPANCTVLMRQPQADYLVRLDSDDLLEPGYISRLVTEMEKYPDAGYGHSAISQIDADGETIDLRRLIRGTGFQDAESALRASLSGYRTVANILTFRREALEAVDFYEGRPQLRQDYDLAVRLADSGYGNVYIDEPLARYRVWTDAKGIRAKRKGAQLDGYRQIFDEAFLPAWERRGWDTRELERQRRRLALHHCPACFDPQYSEEERDELVAGLRELGDSGRLRVWIWVCRHGGAPLLTGLSDLRFRAKSVVKSAVKPLLNRGAGAGRARPRP